MRLRLAAALSCIAVLGVAGCGGGGANGGVPPVTTPAVTSHGTGTATFSLKLPPASGAAAHSRPQYLSVAMQSVTVSLTSANGSAPSPAVTATFNVSATSPNCSFSGGTLVCSVSLTVPTGNDTFAVTTFAAQNGLGASLSSGVTTATVVSGSTSPVTLTLGGVVASIVVSVANLTPPIGAAEQIPVTITAYDAGSGMIVGNTPFVNPITLTTSDSTNAPLSVTSITSPNITSAVNYSGVAITSATISATATGVPPSEVASAVFAPITSATYAGTEVDAANLTQMVIDHLHSSFVITQTGTSTYTYTGTYTPLPNGDLKMLLVSTNSPSAMPGNIVYAREMSGALFVAEPTGTATPNLQGFATNGDLLAGTFLGQCPSNQAFNLNGITLVNQNFDANFSTNKAYVTGAVTISGGMLSFNGQAYPIGGGTPVPQSGSLSCANGTFTGPNQGSAIVSPSGLIATVNNGGMAGQASSGGLGIQAPSANLDLTAVAAQTYHGFTHEYVSTIESTQPFAVSPVGGNLYGCGYANYEGNVLAGAAQCLTFALTGQPSPGLVTGTVTNSLSVSEPIILVMRQVNGQYVGFGIAEDPYNTNTAVNFVLMP